MKLLPSTGGRRRLAILLALLVAVLAVPLWYVLTWADLTVTTDHYVIRSSATREDTEDAGRALEALHRAYFDLFADAPAAARGRSGLRINLYGTRWQFRLLTPGIGWAEAIYRKGKCRAYFEDRKSVV